MELSFVSLAGFAANFLQVALFFLLVMAEAPSQTANVPSALRL